ncbi:MAG: diaminopimelate epimerase [bacterium]
MKINFTKMQASGNDFVVLENNSKFRNKPALAKKLCDRKFGIGADGLLFLRRGRAAGLSFQIYNSDGTHPKMCGNGARCAALWANEKLKIKNEKLKIETDAGILQAEVEKINFVKIKMSEPEGLKLNFPLKTGGKTIKANFVIVGVPHTVIPVKNADKIDVENTGRTVRFHRRFQPEGTNADFVQVLNSGKIKIRTYERGVEGETLSCGTGSTAAAVVLNKLGFVKNRVSVLTKSGESLVIDIKSAGVYLTGAAEFVFKGEIEI